MQKIALLSTLLFLVLSNSAFSQSGLKGQYFDGINFDKLVLERTDTKIEFDWPVGQAPARGIDPANFSVRWTGQLKAPENGVYTFSSLVDDGIRVWVGGVLVIDAWGMNDHVSFSGKVKMRANKNYPIKVEYFNGLLEGAIKLFWELPSAEEPGFWDTLMGNSTAVIVPASNFVLVVEPKPKKEETKPTPPEPSPEKPLAQVTKPQSKPAPAPIVKPSPAVHPSATDTLQQYLPKNVYFKQSKAVILTKSYKELDKLAEMLTRHKELSLTINGHTDNLGDAALNMKLSKDRAKTVARYLIEKGIHANRIEAFGYGGTRPIVMNDSVQSREKNRRVEFILN